MTLYLTLLHELITCSLELRMRHLNFLLGKYSFSLERMFGRIHHSQQGSPGLSKLVLSTLLRHELVSAFVISKGQG